MAAARQWALCSIEYDPNREVQAMKVKDVMTKTVYRITETQMLSDAAQLMWSTIAAGCRWSMKTIEWLRP